MKTALLHYWLTNKRGGENVFRAICGLFPDGDVFTHAYNARVMGDWFGGRRIRETFVGRLPFARKKCPVYLPLMPCASRALRLDGYELIVSSESGPIKGIRKPRGARHVCYCHTPMRYLWDLYDDYYRMAGLGGKVAMRLFRDYLRAEDLKSAESVDAFVANSRFVAARIRRIYGRDAAVVPPPVDVAFFAQGDGERKDYYLLAGQLVAYKRPDLAIAACRRLGRRLVVVGAGDRVSALRRQAAGDPNVVFDGRVSDETLRRRYAEARALLFPGVEDFGIVPVEAQAAGTPVIAFGEGGARETVVDGRTGLFFHEQTVDALCAAMEDFESRRWSRETCRAQAENFSPARFRTAFRAALDRG